MTSLSTIESPINANLSYWARLRQLADLLDASWYRMPSDIESPGQQLVESLQRETKHVAKIKVLTRDLADRDRRIAELEQVIARRVAADGKAVN